MGVPYAEVIGDPIAHSQSPLIHRFWLEKLRLRGDYRAVRVGRSELPDYLSARRADIWWRGCNITAPLKELASGLVNSPAGLPRSAGAVNCIARTPLSCIFGTNTDIAGVGEALRAVDLDGATVCLIGSGGAARSVICFLRGKPIASLRILARDREKAAASAEGVDRPVDVHDFDQAPVSLGGASLVINATPLGMAGQAPMNPAVIDSLAQAASGATIFDTIYAPLETELLRRAREIGFGTVDGLSMLIGQAAPAFEIFFGVPAPREHDGELRERLAR